jgi:hypothetical protein
MNASTKETPEQWQSRKQAAVDLLVMTAVHLVEMGTAPKLLRTVVDVFRHVESEKPQ